MLPRRERGPTSPSGRAVRGRTACRRFRQCRATPERLARRTRAGAIGCDRRTAANIPTPRPSCSGSREFSPFLFDLVRADATRLIRLLSCDPDQHLAALIEKTSARRLRCRRRDRGDASAPSHEGGGGASDRAVRHRRGLAGDAGHCGADRSRRRRGAVGPALSPAAGSRARTDASRPIPSAPRRAAA